MEGEPHGCMICNRNAKRCFCPACVQDKLADVKRFLRQVQAKKKLTGQQMEIAMPQKVLT